jgi:hypothetical protein
MTVFGTGCRYLSFIVRRGVLARDTSIKIEVARPSLLVATRIGSLNHFGAIDRRDREGSGFVVGRGQTI